MDARMVRRHSRVDPRVRCAGELMGLYLRVKAASRAMVICGWRCLACGHTALASPPQMVDLRNGEAVDLGLLAPWRLDTGMAKGT